MKESPASTPLLAINAHRKRETLTLALILLLGIGLRLTASSRGWLWYDEYYSAVFASSSELGATLSTIENIDFHPPLYYLQLRAWALVSTSESWLLLNSVLWGSITQVAVMFCGYRIGLFRGAFVSGVLCACFFPVIKESSELRMYAMLMGLSSLALWTALSQCLSERPWLWGACTATLSIALSWSHGSGFLWLIQWATLAVVLLWLHPNTRRNWSALAVSFSLSALGSLPCILRAMGRRPDHLHNTGATELVPFIGQFLPGGSQLPWLPLIVLALVCGLLIALSDGLEVLPLALLSTSAILFLALFVVGQTVQVVHPRTILFSAPLSLLATTAVLVQGSLSRRVLVERAGAAGITVIGLAAIWDSLPLLGKPERSPSQHRLAEWVEKKHAHSDVWAPRLGVAYSLCWELAEERSEIRPSAPKTCKTKQARSIYWGGRKPPHLKAPYLLVLKSNERTPAIRHGEKLGRFKKKFGHRMAMVSSRTRDRSASTRR